MTRPIPSRTPEGAGSPLPEDSPLLHLEYFREAVNVECPECKHPVRVELSVGYQPVFWLHNRGPDRRSCRLCLYRHPTSREVVVRVVPDHLLFGDYLPVIVAELEAIAGRRR